MGLREEGLNETLAEAAGSGDYAPVPVLHGARHDLGSGGRAVVQQDHQGHFPVVYAAYRFEGLVGAPVPSHGFDDYAAFGYELAGHFDRLVQVSPRIASQVEDQPFHAGLLQPVQGGFQFTRSGLGEPDQLDVSRLVFQHEGRPDAANGDTVPGNRHVEPFVDAGPFDSYVHPGPFLSAQSLPHLVVLDADRRFTVDPDDTISGLQADGFRRRFVDHGNHVQESVQYIELDPDPVELPAEALAHFGEALLAQEAGMGVEHLEHAVDRGVDQLAGLYLLHIVVVDQVEHAHQQPGAREDVVRRVDRPVGRVAEQERPDCDKDQQDGVFRFLQGRHMARLLRPGLPPGIRPGSRKKRPSGCIQGRSPVDI